MVKKVISGVLLLALLGFALVQAMDQEKEDKSPGLKIGVKAPDFALQSIEGEEVKLSSLKGEKVILNFWATWCGPCKAEMPAIEKFHGNHKDVNVIAVNTDPDADVKGFADQLGLTFPIVLDEEDRTMKNYSVMGIPTTYFIDEQGIITQKYIGEMDYEMIEEFAAEM